MVFYENLQLSIITNLETRMNESADHSISDRQVSDSVTQHEDSDDGENHETFQQLLLFPMKFTYQKIGHRGLQ